MNLEITGSRTFDALVVGAGIVGAAIAAALARDGLKVAVFEGDDVATGTTAAGMGHIVAMDDSEAQFALTEYSREIWNQLADALPQTCEFQRSGTIWVAADGEEMEAARRKDEFYRARGVARELLDAKSLRDAEPNLREGLAGGLLVGDDAVVYQPRAAGHFIDEATALGAEVYTATRVVKIRDDGVVTDKGAAISAGATVIAAGIGSPELLRGLKIRPKKGHLVVTERRPGFVRHQIVELGYLRSAHSKASESVAFNVQPRHTDQVLIGSSRQFGSVDGSVDRRIVGQMLRRAFEYMPGLRSLPALRVWTGIRPATDDNLPLIGRHPDFARVFVAAGHEGLGITTATGTAAIIADLVGARKPVIDASPFDPARFLGCA
jgi:glycine/D-amino acid oxidase-like deaminating enzyme